jgi:hypothetical protein
MTKSQILDINHYRQEENRFGLVDEARVGGSDIVDENSIEQQVEMRISELGLASSRAVRQSS